MSETTNDGIAVDLDEVLRLAEAATPPPWFVHANEQDTGEYSSIEWLSISAHSDDSADSLVFGEHNCDGISDQSDKDFAFIAAVRTAFPIAMQRLLAAEAEIARLTEANETLRQGVLDLQPDKVLDWQHEAMTRAEAAEAQNARLRHIARQLAWMARRYADQRRSVAPGLYNDLARELLDLGVELNPTGDGLIWAQDGMGRDFDGLDDEHITPGHPVATGRLIGLPPRTRLADELRKLLGLSEGDGIAAAVERVMELKEHQGSNPMSRSPWTQEQVDALNAQQHNRQFHPLTCGSGRRTDADHLDGEGVLVATKDGWMCPYCDYRQDYSHP